MIYRLGLSRARFEALAADIISEHVLTVGTQGRRAGLFLSGGSTPGPVYTALSHRDLPWDHVDVGLVDERWVDANSAGSNAALIRRTLLQGQAKAAKFLPMKTPHATPQDGQAAVQTAYEKIVTPDSLAVLGMGTDGHVCSWFPQSSGLIAAVDPKNPHVVQAITAVKSAVTGNHLQRMTLTRSALERCKSVVLLLIGTDKRNVLETALSGDGSDLPVSHLLSLETLTILHAV